MNEHLIQLTCAALQGLTTSESLVDRFGACALGEMAVCAAVSAHQEILKHERIPLPESDQSRHFEK